MDNTKRQTVVIAVLILLIACAGWFARNINEDMLIKDTVSKTKISQGEKDVFLQQRESKTLARNTTKEELLKIKADKGANKDAKIRAQAQMLDLNNRTEKEATIEKTIKSKGYQDALCYIERNGVEVSIKAKSNLAAAQVEEIKNIIIKNTGFAPSRIVVKGVKDE